MTIAYDNIDEGIWKDSRFRLLKERVGKSAAMVVLLIQIGTILNQAGNSELFSPLGLSTERYELLFIVRDIPKQRPSDIAKYTLMHPAKVTREVDSLIDDGYIQGPVADIIKSGEVKYITDGQDFAVMPVDNDTLIISTAPDKFSPGAKEAPGGDAQ